MVGEAADRRIAFALADGGEVLVQFVGQFEETQFRSAQDAQRSLARAAAAGVGADQAGIDGLVDSQRRTFQDVAGLAGGQGGGPWLWDPCNAT